MMKYLNIILINLLFYTSVFAQVPPIPNSLGAGNCLGFDGNDYVEVLDNPSIESLNNGSVHFWFNPDYSGVPVGVKGFFSKDMGHASRALYGAYHFTDGNLYLHLNNSPAIFLGMFTPVAGNWYSIAFTWDGTNARSYINGILNQTTSTTLGTGANNLSFYIGSYAWNGPLNSQNTSGQLDEFCIWNVALTQAQIRNNMCHTLTGTESGLVGYWPMDAMGTICGGATQVCDISGNGNNGTRQ